MLRRLNAIAAEISTLFYPMRTRTGRPLKWVENVQPLLDAMLDMKHARGFYGIDTGEQIILKFLNEVGERWHGPDSVRIRGELRQHLYNAKESNVPH